MFQMSQLVLRRLFDRIISQKQYASVNIIFNEFGLNMWIKKLLNTGNAYRGREEMT